LNEDFVLATADTPDSQAEAPKVDQPVEQNDDAPQSSGAAAVTEAVAPEAAAPAATATEAPVAEATETTAEVVEAAPETATETEKTPAEAEGETGVSVAEKPESELTMDDLLEE